LQTISDLKKYDNSLNNKIDSFSKKLEIESFFLLIKDSTDFSSNLVDFKLIERQIEKLIKAGLKNIEIPWSDKENWLDFVSNIKSKFPKINLGSASITGKKSIDDSIKVGLNFSMMKFWDKDLLNYSNSKNHLLIPGINNIRDLKEARDLNCKIIKIYPVKNKDQLINISQYKEIDFIAAGGLSICDIKLYKSLGYKSLVIGNKGFINKDVDPKIYKYLKNYRIK